MDKKVLLKKLVALVFICLTLTGFLLEVLLFAMYVLPVICVQMFSLTSITLGAEVTIQKYLVKDLIVLFMMWVVPCLFVTGLSVYVHGRFAMCIARPVKKWARYIFLQKVFTKKRKRKE